MSFPILTLCTLLLSLYCHVRPTFALWPMPRNLATGNSYIKLHHSFQVVLDVGTSLPPYDLVDAVERTENYIRTDGQQRLVVKRGTQDRFALALAPALRLLRVYVDHDDAKEIDSISAEVTKDVTRRREGYSLYIPSEEGAEAIIKAESALGALRGLTTFSQFWYDDGAGVVYSFEAPIEIRDDRPAFPYRGFMLDTARHFFPVHDIKRTLDAMSWVKLNTFHWHASDSQSFPISTVEYPEVAEKGAHSLDQIYSAQDIQVVVSYAAARGIDVLMEIDVPGHTAAIAESHPEHIACAHATPWNDYGAEPPAGQIRIASAESVNFTMSLLASIAKRLPSKFFSTGGDEVNMDCYGIDSQTQTDLEATGQTLEQALDSFTREAHSTLASLGKTPVVWEEMALEHDVELRDDTVVIVWTSSEQAAAVVAKNLRIVHAPSDYFYLDCGAGGWVGNDPFRSGSCEPFKSWQRAYTFDPFVNLTEAQQSLVLGGQQQMWTEQTSAENLDSIAWPRASVAAEVFWTGATLPDGNPRNVTEALPRLHDIRYRMVQRGVRAIPIQPEWCALRPNACDADA